jgi:hypothetical protein
VKTKELRAQGASTREKKSEWEAKSQTSARRAVLKGTGLSLHLRRRARHVSKPFAHSRARPGETATCNRDTSTIATCRLAETERGLDRVDISITSAEMPAPTTTPMSPLRPKLPQRNPQDCNSYKYELKLASESPTHSRARGLHPVDALARTHREPEEHLQHQDPPTEPEHDSHSGSGATDKGTD